MSNINILIPDIIVITTTLILTLILFSKKIEKSSWWSATVIPLASIIGSGFLVVAPILQMSMGRFAVFAMLALVVVAYMIGSAIRFNIKYIEPKLRANTLHKAPLTFEILSQWALSFAYIVSVTYYLALFGDFLLRGVNIVNPTLSHIITTAVLIFIAVYGRHRGFNFLGRFEALKLSIIGGLIAGLAYGNYHAFSQQIWHLPPDHIPTIHDWQIVLGMLIVVQGFETSRYLGDKFPPSLRIITMRYAQLISGGIYVVYIGLMLYYFNYPLPKEGTDTAIITLTHHVATVLPVMLLVLALIAQFDAAIADAQGGSGLFEELSKQKISLKNGYLIIAIGGTFIVWTSNIFQIITYASQAFAIYYMLQSMVASLSALLHKDIPYRLFRFFGYALVASIALSVVIFGVPAGG